MAAHAAGDGVGNKIERVSAAGVFGDCIAKIIRLPRDRIDDDIFDDRPKADRIPNQRLALLRQLDTLGVAAAFKVEYALIAPAMFVIPNQPTIRVR